jgi:hypothetical protein
MNESILKTQYKTGGARLVTNPETAPSASVYLILGFSVLILGIAFAWVL